MQQRQMPAYALARVQGVHELHRLRRRLDGRSREYVRGAQCHVSDLVIVKLQRGVQIGPHQHVLEASHEARLHAVGHLLVGVEPGHVGELRPWLSQRLS